VLDFVHSNYCYFSRTFNNLTDDGRFQKSFRPEKRKHIGNHGVIACDEQSPRRLRIGEKIALQLAISAAHFYVASIARPVAARCAGHVALFRKRHDAGNDGKLRKIDARTHA